VVKNSGHGPAIEGLGASFDDLLLGEAEGPESGDGIRFRFEDPSVRRGRADDQRPHVRFNPICPT
jgi:hypothetical protein